MTNNLMYTTYLDEHRQYLQDLPDIRDRQMIEFTRIYGNVILNMWTATAMVID